MIIEDENGHIVTTDELRDDYREPTEPDPEPPLSLEQIETALDTYFADDASTEAEAAAFLAGRAVPQLLAELADARERLARWEEAPTQEEWTVTEGGAVPTADAWSYTADAAMKIAVLDGRQAWRRTVTRVPVVVQPWEPIESEPPF